MTPRKAPPSRMAELRRSVALWRMRAERGRRRWGVAARAALEAAARVDYAERRLAAALRRLEDVGHG